jgi:hypothetical protein
MEIINYHSAPLTGFNGDEMFRIDIDDCVISGHPNLISTDGRIMLIPNWEAPHYHYGYPGKKASDAAEYADLEPSDSRFIMNLEVQQGSKADIRCEQILQGLGVCRRDDLDEQINWMRYKKSGSERSFEFPFSYDQSNEPGTNKPYPRRYSGFLKDLYVNIELFKSLTNKDSGIQTYAKLVDRILEEINNAAGNFWDFKLISGVGKLNLSKEKSATMKISDYKFMATINKGTVYSFDYMDADSLLLGLNFKPTLSNAAAIRAIYAPINNPNKPTTLVNGEDELLNYHFKDRLMTDEDLKHTEDVSPPTENFDETLRDIQVVRPSSDIDGALQMYDGKIVRRLVLPSTDILKMLLDDKDEENNPKYTGIMPGIQATFTIQGIGGLRTFMCFLVRNLPKPYSHNNVIFRIINLEESIEHNQWITTITAGLIPLRDYIRTRLGIPPAPKNLDAYD